VRKTQILLLMNGDKLKHVQSNGTKVEEMCKVIQYFGERRCAVTQSPKLGLKICKKQVFHRYLKNAAARLLNPKYMRRFTFVFIGFFKTEKLTIKIITNKIAGIYLNKFTQVYNNFTY